MSKRIYTEAELYVDLLKVSAIIILSFIIVSILVNSI